MTLIMHFQGHQRPNGLIDQQRHPANIEEQHGQRQRQREHRHEAGPPAQRR